MNTYIQDKLLEKHICRFNDGEQNCDCYIAGMTDYHNHIVEKIKELPAFTSCSDKTMGEVSNEAKIPKYGTNYLERETVLSLLQDTNPKE